MFVTISSLFFLPVTKMLIYEHIPERYFIPGLEREYFSFVNGSY